MLESWAKQSKTIARWRQQVFVRECRTSVELNFGGVWVLMEKKMIRFFLPSLLPSCVGYIKAQHKSFQLFFLLYEFGNHNPVFWKDKKTSCRIERTHPCLMQTLHISSLVLSILAMDSINRACLLLFFFLCCCSSCCWSNPDLIPCRESNLSISSAKASTVREWCGVRSSNGQNGQPNPWGFFFFFWALVDHELLFLVRLF